MLGSAPGESHAHGGAAHPARGWFPAHPDPVPDPLDRMVNGDQPGASLPARSRPDRADPLLHLRLQLVVRPGVRGAELGLAGVKRAPEFGWPYRCLHFTCDRKGAARRVGAWWPTWRPSSSCAPSTSAT
ncbi:hypothetical protein BGLA2_650029 [Burkholderia gladioli]|nr:hypothetical protein BGLA2_650029 [Burkholderia gladioli]